MRGLALGEPYSADLSSNLWHSVAWLAGIFIVFVPLAAAEMEVTPGSR